MESKYFFTRQELIGVRCVCIIGIILTHSYIPGLYESGHLWRVPMLFLLGGVSLIPTRTTIETCTYVFKQFYLYICLCSIAYMAIIYLIYTGSENKIIKEYNLYSVFFDDIFIYNNHKNAMILGSWFLIPYAISLLILSVIKNVFSAFKYIIIPLILVLFFVALYLTEPTTPHGSSV